MIEDRTPWEWVRLLMNRDASAWEDLFRAVAPLARRWNLDEDAIQEAFLRLVLALKSGNFNENEMKSGSPEPWLVRVAVRIVIDIHRRRRKEDLIPDFAEDLKVGVASALRQFIAREESERQARLLSQALETLSPELRAVIDFTYFTHEERTPTAKETAEYLGITVDAVEARKNRALAKIREFMGDNKESIHRRATKNGKPLGRPKGSGKKATKEEGAIQEAQL